MININYIKHLRKRHTMLLLCMLTFFLKPATGQIKVGDHASTINRNSLFEMESTNRGLLIPRLGLTSVSSYAPLTAHVTGMVVYNTATSGTGINAVSPGFYFNNGTQWVRVIDQLNLSSFTNSILVTGDSITSIVNGIVTKAQLITSVSNSSSVNTIITTVNGFSGSSAPIINSNTSSLSGASLINTINGVSSNTLNLTPAITALAWGLTGCSGLNSSANFLGTSDNVSLRFRTNNIQRLVIDSLGNVGVGTTTFNGTNPEKLIVNAGITSSVNAIVGKGSTNNYFQLNINNQSNGTNASSDVVATADNGNETTNFVDLGINSSGYTGGVFGNANDAYLYNTSNNFLIGTATSGKALIFMTGGSSQSTNERMRIDGSGNVGIGTITPGNLLEVNSGIGGASGLRLKQMPSGAVLFMSASGDVAQNNNNFYFDATNYRLSITGGTSPNSTLTVGGSVSTGITTKTTNYTASVSDYTILCNTSTNNVKITLPVASGAKGRIYIIKKITSDANTVTIQGNGTDVIDGSNTQTITTQYGLYRIQSDGTSWWIL